MTTSKESREPLSIRINAEERATAETIAYLHRQKGAGEGLRIALEQYTNQIICEGDGEYGEYLCPASGMGDHIFEMGDGEEPVPGQWATCSAYLGDNGAQCGYPLIWRGADALLRALEHYRSAVTR